MRNKLSYWYWKYFWIVYRLYIVYLAYKVRKKDTIRVIFVISELASWKTEELFVQMFLHPRFHPIIGISKTIEVNDTEENLVGYLQKKDYPFINLIRNPNGLKDFQGPKQIGMRTLHFDNRDGLYFGGMPSKKSVTSIAQMIELLCS